MRRGSNPIFRPAEDSAASANQVLKAFPVDFKGKINKLQKIIEKELENDYSE